MRAGRALGNLQVNNSRLEQAESIRTTRKKTRHCDEGQEFMLELVQRAWGVAMVRERLVNKGVRIEFVQGWDIRNSEESTAAAAARG